MRTDIAIALENKRLRDAQAVLLQRVFDLLREIAYLRSAVISGMN